MKDNEVEVSALELTGFEIAVIGMSGRFPGSNHIEEFWENLKNGREGIAFYKDEELQENGVPDELLNNPKYVKGYGWLGETLCFDAGFFGYTPLEAEIMDPQVRLFHQCGYEALEDAGYDVSKYKGLTGIYGGASASFNWQARVELSGKARIFGWFAAKQLTDKDFLGTRVAYKLGLKGPAITVDTACSTSLTAIHLACQGLITGNCDMALAGGVTVPFFTRSGYLYQEGMVNASDGHCRAFDIRADGSNFGNAVAIVVLKRYTEAVAEGDHLYAIIKGTAINNDGNRKAAYTAPSVDGQAGCIRTALHMAEVDPETITYVETHGTGTTLGDPVEIEGLKAAFNTTKKHYCRIGSVKTNVGHLEMAAGVAGFIKTVLALKHRQIPPSLHFEKPNPKIDLANSPFMVNTQLTEWKPLEPGQPLRAGVSSFGIGGTNTHVILEEALPVSESVRKAPEGTRGLAPLPDQQYQLILVSAKTETALQHMIQNLANHFEKKPGINMADAAYTLQVGRQIYSYRGMLVCPNNTREAAELLSKKPGKIMTYKSDEDNRPIVFLFPGLGSQYVNMGRDLYEQEPIFREEMNRCLEILEPLPDYDIKKILYPSTGDHESYRSYTSNKSYFTPGVINQPEVSQIVTFIFEYALARLLIRWGIKPYAMMGYSFGEYTAACISGVLSITDAIKLVVARGKLLQQAPEGVMLSIPLSRAELDPYLVGNKEISLAIDNGLSCVMAGPPSALDLVAKQMKQKKIMCMPVPAVRALHSHMMEPILDKFAALIDIITPGKPQIPYISNVTGDWQTDEDALSPAYWTRHLRETVQFARGMKTLVKEPGTIFLEIGPGRDISTLALRHIEEDENAEKRVLNLVRAPQQEIHDIYYLLNRIGWLWLYGQPIDWDKFYGQEKKQRRRISLPTYPFERQEYRIEDQEIETGIDIPGKTFITGRKEDIADWFYIPTWKRYPIPAHQREKMPFDSCWLVLIDETGLGARLAEQLEQEARTVIRVKPGQGYREDSPQQFTINPREESHYHTLFAQLQRQQLEPDGIVHLWCVTTGREAAAALDMENVIGMQGPGYYSLLNIARALGKLKTGKEIQLTVVTNNMQEVTGGDGIHPGKATVIGPVKIIPVEYGNIKCQSIDVDLPVIIPGKVNPREKKLVQQLRDELMTGCKEAVIAYRGGYRWQQIIDPIRLEAAEPGRTPVKKEGVYLITGGLGGIGLELAKHLAKKYHARLVLTGRTKLPPRDQWESFTANPGDYETLVEKIRAVKDLEQEGTKVSVYSADVSQREQMRQVIDRTREQLGPIDGIIHCAGLADGEMIQRRTPETSMNIFKSKLQGTLVLNDLFNTGKERPAWFILCSSITSILPTIGQVGYCAANAFLDAYAHYRSALDADKSNDMNRMLTISVNWDRWQGIGMANIAEKKLKELTGQELTEGITSVEGTRLFDRILGNNQPQVLVSGRDIRILPRQDQQLKILPYINGTEKKTPKSLKPRPQLDSDYIPPGSQMEQALVNMWAEFFGYEEVGIRDDFFEMGGDSLKALIILPKIHKELQVELPITEFFNRPTIEKISGYIQGAEKDSYFSIEPVEKKEYYLLSSAQKRLYILQCMNPDSIAYNMPLIIPLAVASDLGKLAETFKKLIERHESLGTSFHLVNDMPVQKIHEHVEFEIENYQAEAKVESGDTEGTRGLAPLPEEPAVCSPETTAVPISSFIRPFDLSRAPLLRVALVKLLHTPTALRGHPSREGKSILIVDMHHIISDGVSHQVLVRDYQSLYNEQKLPLLRLQYKDFSQWQNSESEKQNLKRQEEFWIKEFAGEIPVLELPADYPRPLEQSFAGNSIEFEISAGETRALNAVALQEGATLFMVLAAVFNILLSKLSGQEDIIMGIPIAGRRHSDLEKIIGMFVNTLPLRNYPAGDRRFREFLLEVKKRVLMVFENQECPFEELVDKLPVKRDTGRNPLFDVMFALQNINTGGPHQDKETGIEIDQPDQPGWEGDYKNPVHTAKFDLELTAEEKKHELFLTFHYCTKLYKKETIERFIVYFKKIAAMVVKEPEIRISDLEIVSAEEKSRILLKFNDAGREYPKDKTIHRLFAEQAEEIPDRIAIVGRSHRSGPSNLSNLPDPSVLSYISITYRELHEQSGRLACLLIEKGVQVGNIIGIMMERSIDQVIGLLAILKAGAAYLPIDTDYPPQRLDYLLKDSGARVLVSELSKLSEVSEGIEIIDLHQIKSKRDFPTHLTQLTQLNLAYIIYTSGSTGRPRGVMVEHRNVIRLIKNSNYIDFLPGDRLFPTGSLAFDISTFEIWGPVCNGVMLSLATKEVILNAGKLKEVLLKHGITILHLIPQLFNQLAAHDPGIFAGLRCFLVGGDLVRPLYINAIRQRYSHLKILHMYGPTENTTFSTFYPVDRDYEFNIPIGSPISSATAYIFDKYSHLQPVGVMGELCVGGEGIARGYLNNPELTADKFCRWQPGGRFLVKTAPLDPPQKLLINRSHMSHRSYIYRTGDLARWLLDGSIEFLGRIDHQVKIRGFRIETGEIENQLIKHAEIKEAVVIARSYENGERYLCAYITAARDFSVSQLRGYLLGHLPDYMIPSEFVLLEKMPLTNSGKVDRRHLDSSGKKLSTGVEYVAPKSGNEVVIAEAWEKILKVEEVGVYDNFFDLGGTSMDLILLNSKLQEIFKRDIPIAALYRYTTIDSFTQFLGEGNLETGNTPANTRSEGRVARIKQGMADKNKRHEIRKRRNK